MEGEMEGEMEADEATLKGDGSQAELEGTEGADMEGEEGEMEMEAAEEGGSPTKPKRKQSVSKPKKKKAVDEDKIEAFKRINQGSLASDRDGNAVFLAKSAWDVGYQEEKNPDLKFSATKER